MTATEATMQIKRLNFTIQFQIAFSRPAVELVAQSGRLVETIVENLGQEYPPASRDVRTRTGGALDDWLLQLQLFNSLGKIAVSADALNCSFEKLASDIDLTTVVDVLDRITRALTTHSPALRVAFEKVSGSVSYEVVGGSAARTSYFSGVSFPGRAEAHMDISFKSRLRHPSQPAIGLFEVAPRWGSDSQLFFYFEVETTNLGEVELRQRAQIANELVLHALASFQLEQTKEIST